MYKLCQTDQSTRRQRQLEHGLLQLMQKQNYEDISVSDLCEYMQIPRKCFYRYFSSKDGALYALIDHMLADFFQMPLPEEKTRGTGLDELKLFFQFWYENRGFLDALQRSGLSGILVERATNFSLIEGYMPQKFRAIPQHLRETAMSFAVCGLMAMMFTWHRQGYRTTVEELTNQAVELLTTPLLSR